MPINIKDDGPVPSDVNASATSNFIALMKKPGAFDGVTLHQSAIAIEQAEQAVLVAARALHVATDKLNRAHIGSPAGNGAAEFTLDALEIDSNLKSWMKLRYYGQ